MAKQQEPWDADDDASLAPAPNQDGLQSHDPEQIWEDWGEDDARQDQKDLKQREIESIPEGINMYRFLPVRRDPNSQPDAPKRRPLLKLSQHYVREPGSKNEGNSFVHVCGRDHPEVLPEGADDCLTHVVVERLRSLRAYPPAQALADELEASLRVFGAVLKMDPDTGDYVLPMKAIILSMPPIKVYKELTKLRNNQHAGGYFTHPVDGFPVVIEREGSSKLNSTFSVSAARGGSTALPDMGILKRMPDIYELKRSVDQEKLKTELLKALKAVLPPASAQALLDGDMASVMAPRVGAGAQPSPRPALEAARPAVTVAPKGLPPAAQAPAGAPKGAKKKTVQDLIEK